jgi:hypothetical protein
MKIKVFFLFTYFSSLVFSQTHFTIPQNVWRVSYNKNISAGKWIGYDGEEGLKDLKYKFNDIDYSINQYWKHTVNINEYKLEYGFSDESTFILNIPIVQEFNQNHIWSISSDSNTLIIENLMQYYFPKNKSNAGLGNVTIGMKTLFIGNPVWRGGKNKYSIYGGLEATFPFGQSLRKYYPNDVDDNGIPNQFKELPISNGLTEWRGNLFGEFYRRIKGRLININWLFSLSSFNREIINPSYSFLWIEETGMDSISKAIGNSVLFEQGKQIYLSIQGQLELLPNRIFFSSGMDWMLSGRDQYFSNSKEWNSWMSSNNNYDTKKGLSTQFIRLNFLNMDPFNQVGPIPFELELGASWYLSYLTYHTYGYTSSWIKISSYFQAW